jgi:hypothetical protein
MARRKRSFALVGALDGRSRSSSRNLRYRSDEKRSVYAKVRPRESDGLDNEDTPSWATATIEVLVETAVSGQPAMSSAAERRELLKAVYEEARNCTRCPLHQTRTTVVFGNGNANADLMFVGEAPGANEDRMGLPFVGQAGKLLDKLLGEIGMERSDVFVANTLKCRPPDNRDPHPNEIEACRAYLDRQVELIEPVVI